MRFAYCALRAEELVRRVGKDIGRAHAWPMSCPPNKPTEPGWWARRCAPLPTLRWSAIAGIFANRVVIGGKFRTWTGALRNPAALLTRPLPPPTQRGT